MKALDAQGLVLEEVSTFLEAGPEGEQAYFIPAGHSAWQAIRVPGGPAVPYAAASQNKPFSR